MIPTNDFRAINRAHGERRDWRHPRCCLCARLLTYDVQNMVYDCTQRGCPASIRPQHSGPDAETIAHGTDAETQPPQSSSPRPVVLDGGRPGVSPWWVVVALGVGFLAGWYGLFLAIVGRT